MQVEFVARRHVRILGVDYAPGASITDEKIPSRVISSLLNTRRIGQRINGKRDLDMNVVGATKVDAGAVALPRNIPDIPQDDDDQPGGAMQGGAIAETSPTAARVAQDEGVAPDDPLRAFYDVQRHAVAPEKSLRKYLIDLCAAQNLQVYGDVTMLIQRLEKAKGS